MITFKSEFFPDDTLEYYPKEDLDRQVEGSFAWLADFPVWKREDPIFLRLDVALYNKVAAIVSLDPERCVGSELRHANQDHHHLCLDSRSGDLYVDDPRRIILRKNLQLVAGRIILGTVKTFYHLSLLFPLGYGLFSLRKEKKEWIFLANSMKESMFDILRIPVYTLAMVAVHLFAILKSFFNPNDLYASRKRIGRLEAKMLRLEKYHKSEWTLSPCFRPFTNLFKSSLNFTCSPKPSSEEIMARLAFRIERRHPPLFNLYVSEASRGYQVEELKKAFHLALVAHN